MLLLLLNPRGGMRGGRGIHIAEDGFYVANYDAIIKYDRHWNELGRISNQLLTGVHEIAVVRDGIWAASTHIDLAVKMNFSGQVVKSWSPRTSNAIKQVLGIEDKYSSRWPPSIVGWGYLNWYRIPGFLLKKLSNVIGLPDRTDAPWHVLDEAPQRFGERLLWGMYRIFPALSYDDFHLNCVHAYENELHVTIHTWPWTEKASIVRIEPQVAVELGSDSLRRPHNGQVFDDDRLIINDTGTQAVKLFERGTGRLLNSISISDMGIKGRAWLRGLKKVSESHVLVGVGAHTGSMVPTQIIELDLYEEKVVESLVISEEPNTSLHGLDAIW